MHSTHAHIDDVLVCSFTKVAFVCSCNQYIKFRFMLKTSLKCDRPFNPNILSQIDINASVLLCVCVCGERAYLSMYLPNEKVLAKPP